MQRSIYSKNRQGLTVLALLLLIIALAVAGFFLVRYLQSRPGTTTAVEWHRSASPRASIS
jgi:UPF0716 family protein affecting phage T7 exclusion